MTGGEQARSLGRSRRQFLRRAGQGAAVAAAGVLAGPLQSGPLAHASSSGPLFNVLDYGALSYGSRAAALAGSDSSAAIQAAADAAADPDVLAGLAKFTTRAGAVFIPAGHYRVDHQVTLPSSVSVVGVGWTTSFLHSTMTSYGGATNQAALKSVDYGVGACFQDFALYGPGHAACAAGAAFSTGNNGVLGLHPGVVSRDVVISGVRIEGYTNSILLSRMRNVFLKDVFTYAAKEANLAIVSSQDIRVETSVFSNGGMGGGTGDLAPWRSNIYVARRTSTDDFPKYIEFIDCFCDEVYSGTSMILNEVNDFLWDGGDGHLSAGQLSNNLGKIWSGSAASDRAIFMDHVERTRFTNVTVQPWGYGNPAMSLIELTPNAVDVDLGGVVVDLEGGTPYKPSVVGAEVADAGVRTILPSARHTKRHTMADHDDGPYATADAEYLVATSHPGLAEGIVVGAEPGGELGGSWSEPTVDHTHAGSQHLMVATFSFPGQLAPERGKVRWGVFQDATVLAVEARCNRAPIGSAIVIDVNRGVGDGGPVSLYGSKTRPVVAPGTKSCSSVPDVVEIAGGDYLQIDIDSVGAVVPGSHMTVNVVMALR